MLAKISYIFSVLIRYFVYKLKARKWATYGMKPFYSLKRFRQIRGIKPLSQDQQDCLNNLNEKGMSLASPLVDSDLLNILQEAITTKIKDIDFNNLVPQETSSKHFFFKILDDYQRTSNDPFVRFALQSNILTVASHYIGQTPFLSNVEVILSHAGQNQTPSKSQLWHKDYNDTRLFKFFIYLSDVLGEEDGPFTFFPRVQSRKMKLKLLPVHKSDALIEKATSDDAIKVYGPKYTAFLIDTYNCYHQGSRVAPGKTRIIYVATFLTHASLLSYNNQIDIQEPISDFHRLVLQTS